jgi:hypothetical protein
MKPRLYGHTDPRRIRRMTRIYGPECPDFEPSCPTCVGWQVFHYTIYGRYAFRGGFIPRPEHLEKLINGVQQ